MVTGARIAYLFRLDPVAVLAEPDELRRRLRLAAAEVIVHDRQASK